MAWCENQNCRKTGLRKADVEFDDDSKLVLCHGCMALTHPGWMPPQEFVDLTGIVPVSVSHESQFGMHLQINREDGIKASFSYGGISLAINVDNEEYRKFFGV